MVHRDAKPVALDYKRINLVAMQPSARCIVPRNGSSGRSPRLFLAAGEDRGGKPATRADHIRLNTERVKKPKDLLEYLIVHKMAHLIP